MTQTLLIHALNSNVVKHALSRYFAIYLGIQVIKCALNKCSIDLLKYIYQMVISLALKISKFVFVFIIIINNEHCLTCFLLMIDPLDSKCHNVVFFTRWQLLLCATLHCIQIPWLYNVDSIIILQLEHTLIYQVTLYLYFSELLLWNTSIIYFLLFVYNPRCYANWYGQTINHWSKQYPFCGPWLYISVKHISWKWKA